MSQKLARPRCLRQRRNSVRFLRDFGCTNAGSHRLTVDPIRNSQSRCNNVRAPCARYDILVSSSWMRRSSEAAGVHCACWCAIGCPIGVHAQQQAGKVPRIGFLSLTSSFDAACSTRSGKGCASSGGLRARILSSTIDMRRIGSTGCPTWRPSWSGSRWRSSYRWERKE